MQPFYLSRRIFRLCLLTLMLGATTAFARRPEYIEKKEIVRSFPAEPSTVLRIDNEFGSITVEHGEKNLVEIKAVVQSKSRSENNARNNLDGATVALRQTGNRIEGSTSLRRGLRLADDERVWVDYIIRLPSRTGLDLRQQFGDVRLADDHRGATEIKLMFGTMRAGSFRAPFRLRSEFSKCTLGDLSKAAFDLRHCERIELGNADELAVNSQFSNITAGDVGLLRLDEKHGSLRFRSCRQLHVTAAHFSRIDAATITGTADVDGLKHSEMKIGELSPEFNLLKLNANFSNVRVGLQPGRSSFRLDGETSFSNIRLARVFRLDDCKRVEKGNKKILTGRFGKGRGLIEIRCAHSTVELNGL